MKSMIVGVLTFLILLMLSYLIIAGLTYLVCLGFGLPWSWLMALGVWALIVLIRYVFKSSK